MSEGSNNFTVQELADIAGGTVVGDGNAIISGINSLDKAGSGEISYVTSKKYLPELEITQATAVILPEELADFCKTNAVIVRNSHAAFARIASSLYPLHDEQSGIHDSAIIGQNTSIDKSAWIGPNCVIGDGVTLHRGVHLRPGCVIENGVVVGENSTFHANVSIMHDCVIGKRVLIHSGAVIGSDGFGQANDNGVWVKIPQIGRVILEDDVEIGANCTIDRGAIHDTVIEQGSKLDNLVHVAHNVRIGENCVIAALSGFAGSTTMGNNCMVGGMASISGHITIADNVTLTGRATARQSIKEAGVYSSGTPLEDNRSWHRNYARFKQLDEMAKKLKHLEKAVSELEGNKSE